MVQFRKKAVKAFYLALFISLGLSTNTFALDRGDKAPDFSLPGTHGMVKLSHETGSVIYLDFWASWCGPCHQSFPWMNQIQAKYKSKGLEVIAVNLDGKTEDARKFLSQMPAAFTVAFDSKGETPRLYGVKGMPTSFLIDRNGKIVFQHAGFRPADRDEIEKQIQAALGEKR
jgi:thiol-disulfide isomerase/thioredoxin